MAQSEDQERNSYNVRALGKESSEPFSNYLYEISRDGRKVAELSHDHRGDEFFIRKPFGDWVATDRLIDGGGPEPLVITSVGSTIIDRLLAGK
jgi:hypothetical protein